MKGFLIMLVVTSTLIGLPAVGAVGEFGAKVNMDSCPPGGGALLGGDLEEILDCLPEDPCDVISCP